MRFEIQLKADFAELVYEKTHDSSFWKRKKYYLPDALKCKKKGKTSKYFLTKKKITSCIKRLNYNTIGPSHLVAMYTCPFGTFQELFKCIDRQYKSDFIQKYTKNLEITGYKILNTYFESIRKIRNRCAHGNHIITTKILFELNNLKFGMTQKKHKNAGIVLEKTFDFIFDNLYCGKECKKELSKILDKYKDLLIKYAQNHSMPIKLFKHIDE